MDEHAHETSTGSEDTAVHRVDECAVRLAMERLELADRTLNVYRATAFLTALGITVSHDGGAPMSGEEDDDADADAGDVANLFEVRSWLRDGTPAMTVEAFRERRRAEALRRRATA